MEYTEFGIQSDEATIAKIIPSGSARKAIDMLGIKLKSTTEGRPPESTDWAMMSTVIRRIAAVISVTDSRKLGCRPVSPISAAPTRGTANATINVISAFTGVSQPMIGQRGGPFQR